MINKITTWRCPKCIKDNLISDGGECTCGYKCCKCFHCDLGFFLFKDIDEQGWEIFECTNCNAQEIPETM